jgi:hypothetical protein
MSNGDDHETRGANLVVILMHFGARALKEKNDARALKEKKSDDKFTLSTLAHDAGIDYPTLSKYGNGHRAWSEGNLEKAHRYLTKFSGAGGVLQHDLTSLDSVELVRKIVPNNQEQHILIGRLIPSSRIPAHIEQLNKMIGFYVSVYLCRNPKNTDQLGISVDAFEFRKGQRVDELYVEQINFPHDEKFLPTGRLRLRSRIIEIDVDYMHDYPAGKFLAPMPELDPGGKYNFIATMLDVKVKSRLVVARPLLFIQVDEGYTSWDVQPEGTGLYREVWGFLEKNAQFEGSNFELCPTREARFEEWRPVVNEVKAVIAKSRQGRGPTGG